MHFPLDFNWQKPDVLVFLSVIPTVAVQRPSTGKVLSLWDRGQQEKWHRRGQVGLLCKVWIRMSTDSRRWFTFIHVLFPLRPSSGTATSWASRIFLTISASWSSPGCVLWMGRPTFAQGTRCFYQTQQTILGVSVFSQTVICVSRRWATCTTCSTWETASTEEPTSTRWETSSRPCEEILYLHTFSRSHSGEVTLVLGVIVQDHRSLFKSRQPHPD